MLACGTACTSHFPPAPFGFGFALRLDQLYEDVVKGNIRTDPRYELARVSDGRYTTSIDQRNAVTKLVKLVHRMWGDDHGRSEATSKIEDVTPPSRALG
jgi:hypothetical protein